MGRPSPKQAGLDVWGRLAAGGRLVLTAAHVVCPARELLVTVRRVRDEVGLHAAAVGVTALGRGCRCGAAGGDRAGALQLVLPAGLSMLSRQDVDDVSPGRVGQHGEHGRGRVGFQLAEAHRCSTA